MSSRAGWLLPISPPNEGPAWFVHAITAVMAVWLSVRGGVIVVFGGYYLEDPGFQLLNVFPLAPESWGWLLLGIGGLSLASVLYDLPKLLRPCAIAAAVGCTVIGTVVLTSFFDGNIGSAYIATSWYGLGMMFFLRYMASVRWNL